MLNDANDIRIEIVYGSVSVGDEDRQRAKEAAADSLNRDGVTAVEAFRAYCECINSDEEEPFAAKAWRRAQDKADYALTAGWHNPNGAACFISA